MLEGIYVLNIKLELLSGLYIGGNDSGFDIGGADSDVIRNPLTNEPYIPGSSLKGKLKSLLKYHIKEVDRTEKDIIFKDSNITNIFEPIDEGNVKITRAIFRDLTLTKESEKENFWDDKENSSKVFAKLKRVQRKLDSFYFVKSELNNLIEMNKMVLEEFDEDLKKDIIKQTLNLKDKLEKLELETLLSGKYDINNAIITLHPGAGGTESQDWAQMLYRMYRKMG